ncbi:MAG: hypothetical protein HY801_08505 [Candidatus Lindowbacteria bacterium]|nr:hypothetical protein [Candidatus Lindowbacteria bacterium]
MAEATTRKGSCPYCGFQMMLVTEDKKVVGAGADDADFIWFFSPACKKLFFAYQTHKMGKCPYCGEAIDLTAPATIEHLKQPSRIATLLKANFGKLLMAALGLFAVSIAGIYILLENRVILSLEPVEGALSEAARINLSRRLIKKKRLTLGGSTDDDIVVRDPSLKNTKCTFSFVRVGGRIKNHDKVRIGDTVFEVHAQEK